MRGVIRTETSLITGPTVEPLSLAEARLARKISGTSLDALLRMWIAAARRHFEGQTGRQLITATWELWLDAFPVQREIELPIPPLQSVTSIKYDDAAGDEQTYSTDNYSVIAPSGDHAGRGRVALNANASWPTTVDQPKAVRVRFVAGYGNTADSVPEVIKAALLFLVGHFHRYGEEVQDGTLQELPFGAKAIIQSYALSNQETLTPRSWVD